MYKKNVVPLLFLLLFGCSTMDNMVGFGVSFDKALSKPCVTTALSNIEGVSEFMETESGVSFVLQQYKVDFDYAVTGSLINGYEVNIDGMFLGQSSATFIQNSNSLQKRIHSIIEQGCY